MLRISQYFYKSEINIDEYIAAVGKCTSLIHTYQPFYDGNTRTCLLLQKISFQKIKLNFNINNKVEDLKQSTIRMIFSLEEEVSLNYVSTIKQMLLIDNENLSL